MEVCASAAPAEMVVTTVVVRYAMPGMEVKETEAFAVETRTDLLDEVESWLLTDADPVQGPELDENTMLGTAEAMCALDNDATGAPIDACCAEVITVLCLTNVDTASGAGADVPLWVDRLELPTTNEKLGRLVVVIMGNVGGGDPFALPIAGTMPWAVP